MTLLNGCVSLFELFGVSSEMIRVQSVALPTVR